MNKKKVTELPDFVTSLFWDCEPGTLSWEKYTDFIISRILSDGRWDAVQWLRSMLTDDELKEWLIKKHGAKLDSPKLRFWELILNIDTEIVNTWLQSRSSNLWQERVSLQQQVKRIAK